MEGGKGKGKGGSLRGRAEGGSGEGLDQSICQLRLRLKSPWTELDRAGAGSPRGRPPLLRSAAVGPQSAQDEPLSREHTAPWWADAALTAGEGFLTRVGVMDAMERQIDGKSISSQNPERKRLLQYNSDVVAVQRGGVDKYRGREDERTEKREELMKDG